MSRSWLAISLFAILAVGPLSSPRTASGAIVINEIMIDVTGADDGSEFFELRSTTGGVESMAGLTLLVIEGDNGGGGGGVVDLVFNLNSFSTGTNGLFLWRDTSTELQPARDPATTLNVSNFTDMENGSQTFLLVRNFSGAVGSDVDANNDGVLDTTFWTEVVDGIGYLESGGSDTADVAYASELGFTEFGFLPFTPDTVFRNALDGSWIAADVLGTNPGPFEYDTTAPEFFAFTSGSFNGTLSITSATPGSANTIYTPIPEPSTYALIGLSVLVAGVALRRGRRVAA